MAILFQIYKRFKKINYEVWLDNAESFRYKLEIKKYDIASVDFLRIDGKDEKVWNKI